MNAPAATPELARNITRLSHMELPGAGQVYIQGHYAFVGHLTNADRLGTTILDISDPRKPSIVSQIMLDDPEEFAALLQGHDVKHIFFGHGHRGSAACGAASASRRCRRSTTSFRWSEAPWRLSIRMSHRPMPWCM